MGILSWIILGLLAGGIAKFLMPGKDPGGCFITILLGIVGAAVGGWIGTQLGFGSVQQFDLRGLGIAILGSLILLLIYRMVAGRK
ncbi:putative membrane protein YeaQ/YmgE (transglycosylase-associated protein family) [Prosthecobacter fusiformis]|uniref:Putative membrane protein YeaQ/YmgE (Transglycosylase-associated protein family) n=1 Tax=Prosthecobacter fusiformis TaxID=48464 RepID=A0A4R7RY33_9BACT|nr:GlsB/YeaQ/YmgE family stress response membrane protein [Prosthecobacter fusiformis]TDU70820.1 putative membrane protein YeaQ/YmgE (transglycosylase-associated protein family) [Prosthecobacter fusiformis]